jgi:hypothetical protein
MIIPDNIQVALDAIEEENSFALEAEYQLVEWLEEIESGCSSSLIILCGSLGLELGLELGLNLILCLYRL